MTKLVTFLGRRTAAAVSATAAEKPAIAPLSSPPPQPAPVVQAANAAPAATDIQLDEELFFPIATQLGQENETVRNLLIDAEHKIGELETIKRSIGKLVDPVSKTLRAYEETKSEKLSLQNVLNSTRVAHSKARDDLASAERKVRSLEAEGARLREVVAAAQQAVANHEKTKAEQLTELAARRSQIVELQRHVQQLGADIQQVREENRRNIERVTAADKRAVQLEGEAQASQQRALQAAQEQAAVQSALDRLQAEHAQMARRLTETEKTLSSTQARLKSVEASLAEAQAQRSELSAALDEANHKHLDALSSHNSRHDALQARATLTERLLEEARQALMARADEIRSLERRVIEHSTAHEATLGKLSQAQATVAEHETQIRDLEQSHATLHEHNQALSYASAARDSAYGNAEQKIREQADLIQLLETQMSAMRSTHEMQLEQLNAQLKREQLERSMAEGALESGRQDIARLLREISATQGRPNPLADLETAAERLRSAA